jgi:hypothetical protein
MSDLNVDAVKAKLRGAPGRIVNEVKIDVGDDTPITLVVRRIATEKMVSLFDKWKAEGLVDKETSEPVSTEAGLEINRRLMALVLYMPKAIRPLYTADELRDLDWVDGLLDAVKDAFGAAGKAVQAAKGNS